MPSLGDFYSLIGQTAEFFFISSENINLYGNQWNQTKKINRKVQLHTWLRESSSWISYSFYYISHIYQTEKSLNRILIIPIVVHCMHC